MSMSNYNNDADQTAYFSMEVGISYKMPTYSGGLGVLAGDTLKSFADLGKRIVGITLLNEKGYFTQTIDENGVQNEKPVNWNPNDFMTLLPNTVTINIEGRDVKIKAWKYLVKGISGHTNPLFFLDTNIEGNSDYDRELTMFLYGKDRKYRLCQEIVLGIGGIKMLDALGYHNIKTYHMNEGHASLLTVELLRKHQHGTREDKESFDLEAVREKCVFTTHTPVSAGHDRFDKRMFKEILGDYVPEFVIDNSSEGNKVNMTLICLNNSKYVNGVAKRHEEITKKMFPKYHIDSITNGVHHMTWTAREFKRLFDEHIPSWRTDPFTLRYALSIPSAEILEAHSEAKKMLIDLINERTKINFDVKRFTIGYARRMTSYKRPDLFLHDINRLKKIAEDVGDIQIVYAGKAHKQDTQGKELIKKIVNMAKEVNKENGKLKIVFLEDYNMKLAKRLVTGCDAWLNTPQRPFEASGTSGMKAALNGVPQISTLDGWWLEGHIEGVTGWSLGPHPNDEGFDNDYSPDDEAEDLYNKLEKIVPIFYGRTDEWSRIMKYCIAINGSFFNSYRMVQQYLARAYDN